MQSKALIFTAISILAFILIQDERWLLGWDFLDMIFMTALLIGIDRKWDIFYFTVIYASALTNRESALFIPLWMCIDAAARKEKMKIAYSILLAGIGIAAVYVIREKMFAGSCQDYIGMDTVHAMYGNHYWMIENLMHPFTTFPPWKPDISLVPAIVIATIGYFAFQWKELARVERCIVIFLAAMAGILFVTVVIHETRSWFITIPFIVYLIAQKYRRIYGK